MSHLNEFLTHKMLSIKLKHDDLIDVLEDDGIPEPSIKNVCVKLLVPIADRIDFTVERLQITKRSFIQAALINAMNEADRLWKELELDQYEDL